MFTKLLLLIKKKKLTNIIIYYTVKYKNHTCSNDMV